MLADLGIDLVLRNLLCLFLTLFYNCHHMYLQDSDALLLMFLSYFIYLNYYK